MKTNTNKKIELSLVIPCYNEEINLQKGVLDKVKNFADSASYIKEVIIVDDGSTDSSPEIIKAYLKKFPILKYKRIKHQGKAAAVSAGILSANYAYTAFTDIDMATPIEELNKLKKYLENNYQIVIGSRNSERKGAPLIRKLMAKGFILLRNLILRLGDIKDTQCGFKAFETKSARKILSKMHVFNPEKPRIVKGPSVTAGFDLEFLYIASKLGYKIKEIPVEWKHVETRNVNFLKDSIESLKDILTIKLYSLKGYYK
ncbi:MAG: glycosyl transferase [Patescibacteria group bacterium]|nr:MAG: glycosyl transferase [Patescibacteria group bacterium]